MIRTRQMSGLRVVSSDGALIGAVSESWPLDGGGLPEMVLVRLGRRFPRLRWLPLEGTRLYGDRLIEVPFTRDQILDAPDAEDRRWGEPADVARGHWFGVAD